MTNKPRTVTTMTQTRVDKLVREPKRQDHSDHQVTGLYLRQTLKGATWQIRTMHARKAFKATIGSPPAMTLVQARQIATAGISRIRQGYEIDDRWLDAQRVAVGLQPAPAPLASVPRVRSQGLLYEDAVTAFIESIKGKRRDGAVTSYRSILTNPAVRAALYGKSVTEIDRKMVARIVATMASEEKFAAAELLVSVIKLLWGHLSSDMQADKTGVAENIMLPLKNPVRPESKPKGFTVVVPELQTIGKAVAACRSGNLHPSASMALEFVVYTVQRRETVASAHVDDIILDDEIPHWAIDRTRMKGRVEHHIPLYGRSLEIARQAVKAAQEKGSVFLFPEGRRSSKRAEGEIGHINVTKLSQDMQIASGMSPHRARHAFISLLIDKEIITEEDGALVLDHLEGRRTTTARRYKRAKELTRKVRIMQHWTDLIAQPVEDAIAAYDTVTEKLRIQAARKAKSKTPRLSEGKRNRKSLAAYIDDRRAKAAVDEAEKQFMLQVSEEHRTGHKTDQEAIHALRISGIQELVIGRLLLGHDLAERPDLHPLRDAVFRKHPDFKVLHEQVRAALAKQEA